MSKLHTIWTKLQVKKEFSHIPYYISIDGDIINLEYKDTRGYTRKRKVHKLLKDTKGYWRIKTKAAITPSISRNIGLHFIPNPDNKPEVNHIDGNKDNNYYENLNWMTTRENIQHAIENNLRKPMLSSTAKAGAKAMWAKYSRPKGSINNSSLELR